MQLQRRNLAILKNCLRPRDPSDLLAMTRGTGEQEQRRDLYAVDEHKLHNSTRDVWLRNVPNHARTTSNRKTLLRFWVGQEEVLGEKKEETGAVEDHVDSVMGESSRNEFVLIAVDQFVFETTRQTEQHRTRV